MKFSIAALTLAAACVLAMLHVASTSSQDAPVHPSYDDLPSSNSNSKNNNKDQSNDRASSIHPQFHPDLPSNRPNIHQPNTRAPPNINPNPPVRPSIQPSPKFQPNIHPNLPNRQNLPNRPGLPGGDGGSVDHYPSFDGHPPFDNQNAPINNNHPQHKADQQRRRRDLSSSASSSSSVLRVRDFGAVGDGQTDDTQAFAQALAAASDMGGTIVFVDVGAYLLTQPLFVGPNVILQGVLPVPASGCGSNTNSSTLLTTWGHGKADATPFLSMGCNAALIDIKIYHPLQNNASDIVPYPWTVHETADDMTLINVLMINPYQAVNLTGPGGRHYIQGLYGQPLYRGISVDNCFDIGRIQDVHFWPFWSQDAIPYTQKNAIAFTVARSDWEYIFNTFAFGYNIGYLFKEGAQGSCNGNFLGLGSDASQQAAIRIEQADEFGMQFTNCELVAMGTNQSTQIVVAASNSGSVRFVNCALWGPSQQVLSVAGSGTVGISDTTVQWKSTSGVPAMQVSGNGSFILKGTEFRPYQPAVDAPVLSLDETVSRAIVLGNLFSGTGQVINKGMPSSRLQQGFNIAEKS